MQASTRDYGFIFAGALLIALGMTLFFNGNRLTTGGTPGMALLLHHLSDLPIGGLILAINTPLLLLGQKYLGRVFLLRSILVIALIAAFTDLLTQLLQLPRLSDDRFLASVFGGALIGTGIGCVLRSNASAGGSTIIARIICAHSELQPGQVILLLDTIIVSAAIPVFGETDTALWSIVSIYVTSRMIDTLLSGGPNQKVVHIASEQAGSLSHHISEKLGKEGTILQGQDLQQKKGKQIILVLVKREKLRLLRQIIQDQDPQAVMVVMNASELIGR